ncbi:hypothetical protein A3715_15815 [Oleiphilus sp. HI0009]|nr:hypothetical protein A3715_15815 [Oleiphilus sp. HI0009]
MNILGIDIRRPTSKGILIVGCVFLMCILINIGMHALAGTHLSRDTFIMMMSSFLAGSLSNACGVSVADHGWRAMIILVVLGTVLWGFLNIAIL